MQSELSVDRGRSKRKRVVCPITRRGTLAPDDKAGAEIWR